MAGSSNYQLHELKLYNCTRCTASTIVQRLHVCQGGERESRNLFNVREDPLTPHSPPWVAMTHRLSTRRHNLDTTGSSRPCQTFHYTRTKAPWQ